MKRPQFVGSFIVSLTMLCAIGAWAGAGETVKLKTLTSVDKVRQGSTFQVAVVLDIGAGWHAYDNKTKEPYTATNLKLTPPAGFTMKGSVVYPKGEKKNLPGAGGEVSVYEGQVVMGATLTAKGAPLGKQTLKAAVSYQVCNDTMCQRPVRGKSIVIPVEVVKSNAPAKEINKDVFSKPPFKSEAGAGLTPQGPVLATITPTPVLLAGGGIIETIAHKAESIGDFVKTELGKGRLSVPLLFFLWIGGVLSAFSPCVIPVIPLTVAFFGNQSRQAGGRAKALVLALFYIAGIAVMYSAIGVAAVLAGKSLSFLLRGPFLWLFIVTLFGAMGLSMLGLFEIPVPAFMTSVAGARTGFIGAFVMGLVASVLFLPCAGPVVGGVATGLLALAQNAASTLTLLKTSVTAFIYYAIGLGTPFVALALLSGSAMKAPRAGDWTVAIKRLFGLVFLGLSLFFTQYVPHIVLMATFLIGCGIYLAFFEKGLGARSTGKVMRVAAAGAIMFAGVSIGLPKGKAASSPVVGSSLKSTTKNLKEDAQEIAWQPYSDALLKEAAQRGKPVMIDFTADW
jgi:thiol:disulfide interchange protein DsbD